MLQKISQEKTATISILLAGSLWGMIGLFSRSLSQEFSSLQITFLRCFIVTGILLTYISFFHSSKLKVCVKDLWLFFGTGICSIAFFNLCYFKSIQENTLSIAAILLYTGPAFVVIMSFVFFHEKISRKKGSAVILSFVGALFTVGVFSAHSKIGSFGLLIGLGSGFGYALYSIFGRIALKKYHWMTVTLYTFLFATIFLLFLSEPLKIVKVLNQNATMVFLVIALGFFSTLLPFLLYTYGLRHMEAGKAALLTFIEPVAATLIGVIVFQELFTWYNAIGIVLVVLSLVIMNTKQ